MNNKNLKNPQVAEQFANQVKSGQVFILDKAETANADYTMLYLAQNVSVGTGNQLNSLFLGWNGQIFRCLRNVKNTEIDNIETALGAKLEIGNVLPDNFNIQVVDNTTPDTWETDEGLQTQEPRKFREDHEQFPGQTMLNADGEAIYRHTELVMATKEEVVNIIVEPVNAKLEAATTTSLEPTPVTTA